MLKDGFSRAVCCCSNLWVRAIWEISVTYVTTSHIECETVGALRSIVLAMLVMSVIIMVVMSVISMVIVGVASIEVVAVRQLRIAARKKCCASVDHLMSESKLLAVKSEGILIMIKILLSITACVL